jgi:hypothetical protein
MTKKPKRKESAPLPNCEVCSTLLEGKYWIKHHLSYDPEIIAVVCRACHIRMHGLGRTDRHPFKAQFQRDIEPYKFSLAVVNLYERKFIEVALKEQAIQVFVNDTLNSQSTQVPNNKIKNKITTH